MGADIDTSNADVIEELKRWGKWYYETVQIDGFRLDAIKHIDFEFFKKWLGFLREQTGQELFAVGEYWSPDIAALTNYLEQCDYSMSLMDVPLHFNFYSASHAGGNYDMGSLLNNTLLRAHAQNCVTFVDNHDTQPGQSLTSWVDSWFKPLAYAVILLREEGFPCVFYGDYYGIPNNKIPSVNHIEHIVQIRILYAYGPQHDYFDHQDIVGWTREGDEEHPDSGIAVIMTDKDGGEKNMYIGKHFAGQEFFDVTKHATNIVTIADDGNGIFTVTPGSVSVWVTKNAYEHLTVQLP